MATNKKTIPDNKWRLLLWMLAGLTFGNFIGEICKPISFLAFLSFGQSFGIANPVELNLGFLLISFKFQLYITLIGIIGMALGVVIYKRVG
ncbi:hypothetical protein AN640_06240 [Candidatus Epulonipiscium fishelsonii]|uniref:Uncharacterized protein n=1 Tax=Candidatus Epulonipiscium fishelsonii TaxID=77094 RepID=A0ACC8XI74_9FIRM|nr:hypothetical protein AN640_06240 [Epulopiscium sp. SCG-D08WGA-EpuloA1]OON90843.1 MAG: hypothetical protein ATN32_03115 [Epulopiscium sp. AS2M-Bin002]